MDKKSLCQNLLRRTRYLKLGAGREEVIARVFPTLALDLDEHARVELAALFPVAVSDINLEIGFGSGEHLVAEASRLPTSGFIGCETYATGLARVLNEIDLSGLNNVRLYAGDGLDVVRWLPDGCLSRIDVLFPDPWPKLKHQKRRLLRDSNIPLFARVLRPQSELRFASDNLHYATQVFDAVCRSPLFDATLLTLSDCVDPWEHFSGTIYNTRATREGRQSFFLRFRRNSNPVSIL
ncbi:MAG: tRNA (guanosine(46)-N7)-methyltransferase TrmB [Cyanobacteria bacterium]|nr:tRNA (guanosine(46)-N7)-methyltransferase TrmB [Cyanobacteriota bacterium]